MRYKEFQLIKEGYKEVTVKFITASSDESEVKKYMMAYKDLVNRNQVQGDERNIDWWSKQGWKEFKKFVDAMSTRKSKSQKKKNRDAGKSITLEETDKWLIVVPLDKDASCFYGRGSSWCTASKSDNYFTQYFVEYEVTLIYFILKDNASKWAMTVGETEEGGDDGADYFDIEDDKIDAEEFREQTGLDPQVYINMVHEDNNKEDYSSWGKIEDHRDDHRSKIDDLDRMIEDVVRTGKQDRETETMLIKYGSATHVRNYIRSITPDDEDGSILKQSVNLDQDMQTLVAADPVTRSMYLSSVSNLTTKTMMSLINQNPNYIKYFESSKVPFEVEKAAIDISDDVFKHIENPSEQIAAYTLKHNPVAIHLPYFWSKGNTTNEHLKIATQTAYTSMLGLRGSSLASWIDDISQNYKGRDLVSKFSSWLLWVAKTYKDDFEGARAVQDYLYRRHKNHPLLKTIYSQFPQIKPQPEKNVDVDMKLEPFDDNEIQ